MNAIEFIKRRKLGYDEGGRVVYSRRDFRGFFIALLAAGNPVILNARIDGKLDLRGTTDARVAGTIFGPISEAG